MKNSVDHLKGKNKYLELCYSEENLKHHLEKILSNHTPQKYIFKKVKSKPAAVLIPIYFKNDEAHILFTKRTEIVEHHKGQISFPGGSRDPDDIDLEYTALRETEEEVGIKKQDIQIVGQTDIFLTNTHFLVTPYVGFFGYPYSFSVSENEIDRLIGVPLSHFFDEQNFEVKPFKKENYKWLIHYYYFNHDVIWGVTGFLLSNFLSIAFGLNRNLFNPSK